jgi:hypothetical protein
MDVEKNPGASFLSFSLPKAESIVPVSLVLGKKMRSYSRVSPG